MSRFLCENEYQRYGRGVNLARYFHVKKGDSYSEIQKLFDAAAFFTVLKKSTYSIYVCYRAETIIQ